MAAVHLVIGAIALVFAQQQLPPPAPPETSPPASIDHVRDGLDRPPSKLTLKEHTPTFKVYIEQRRPMQDIFDTPPWQLPAGWHPPAMPMLSAFGTPMFSVDLMPIVKGVRNANRARDERRAREGVQRAIAEYCATQPLGGIGILMCATVPTVR